MYNESNALRTIKELTPIIDHAILEFDDHELHELPRRRDFTMKLLAPTGVQREVPATVQREVGIAFAWYGNHGHIQRNNGERIPVNASDIIDSDFKQLKVGKTVEFTVIQVAQSKRAIEVKHLD